MKENIINETINQICRYGFKKFTLDDIAKALRISKKSIYKYFKSKDDLVSSTIDFILEKELFENEKIVQSNLPITEKFEKMIMIGLRQEVPLSHILELKILYPDLWKSVLIFAGKKRMLTCKIITEGINEGIIRKDVDANLITLGLETLIYSLLGSPVAEISELNLLAMLKELQKAFMYGIIIRDEVVN